MAIAPATRTVDGIDLPAEGTWLIDPAHSSVEFTARHLMVSKVRGRFGDLDGVIHVDAVPEHSHVDVTIQASSIDTTDSGRDEHLRSPDFLDVERYPTLRFRSTAAKRSGRNRLEVTGDLTIRDVTRQVTLDVEYLGVVLDPWGNSKTAFSATAEIDREEFGITWNQALETGGVLVGRKVRIDIEVAAVRSDDS